ncbi:uncharacterized, partial [Tachysurus ichikawai]
MQIPVAALCLAVALAATGAASE